jgi:phosphoglycolate phosphatase-like HAD superfamily hydrolase
MKPLLFSLTLLIGAATAVAADPLPSWTDTQTRTQLIGFVEAVTDPASDSYVTPEARIAVFDNDGTLWSEQPVYLQLFFAMDDIARRSKDDPSILTTPARKAAAAGDLGALMETGKDGLVDVLMLSHSGMTTTAFAASVQGWLDTARHPTTGLPFDAMTYQPMVELLRYLRDEGFATYIVSGGGVHFMRVFAERAYGIPPQQVIGSSLKTSYRVGDAGPEIVKDGELFYNDDKEGKPLAIDRHIGRRPILAVGNSDGDFQMLEYTTAGDGLRLGVLIHHTDADREWAYDRDGHIGVLNRGLDEGPGRGWLIVDMAKDWSRIYTGAR